MIGFGFIQLCLYEYYSSDVQQYNNLTIVVYLYLISLCRSKTLAEKLIKFKKFEGFLHKVIEISPTSMK